jgi:dihydroflavonol-4-reductase
MIVAITGATGHVGSNLIRTLPSHGYAVRALIHRNQQSLAGLNVPTVQADVTDIASLDQAFRGADVVYHLAACISLSMNDWKTVEAINVKGTQNVVQACLSQGVKKLVHFSSIHAMQQEPYNLPLDETRPLVQTQSCPPYDRSKALSEQIVRESVDKGLYAIILNPTSVVGPDDYGLSHMGEALLTMARGRLPALIEGGFDWVDVRDVVNAAIAAQEKAPPGSKYLLPGHYATICELAALTENILGVPQPHLVCPDWLARGGAPLVAAFNRLRNSRQLFTGVTLRALSHCNQHISCERAAKDLNYEPRPLRDTLKDTFRWFQKKGLLE